MMIKTRPIVGKTRRFKAMEIIPVARKSPGIFTGETGGGATGAGSGVREAGSAEEASGLPQWVQKMYDSDAGDPQ